MARCPRCSKRAAKRHCPALRTKICSVCCARERMVELGCPETCTYLEDARMQVAEREREWRSRDRQAGFLYPPIQEKWEPLAYEVEFTLVEASRGLPGEPGAVSRPTNEEIVQAFENAIKNLETGAAGLIYEHRAASLRVEELSRRLGQNLAEIARRTEGQERPRSQDLIGVLGFERAVVEGHIRRAEDECSYLRYISLYVKWPEKDSGPRIVLA